MKESDFTSMHEALFFVSLDPGIPYLLCPSSAQPGMLATFKLSIYSSGVVECSSFPETQSKVRGGRGGGGRYDQLGQGTVLAWWSDPTSRGRGGRVGDVRVGAWDSWLGRGLTTQDARGP